jgi:cyclophilin family peptidyl-prolyl cis-trans isomerase
MNRSNFCFRVLFCLVLVGCDANGVDEVAVVRTNMGNIVIAFYEDTPRTTKNFKKLARERFYDGLTFHRVIPGFVIQGGDPNTKDADRANDGLGGPGYTLPAEIRHQHARGAVAAARMPDEVNPKWESSGSQFYICLEPQPALDRSYTVFGYVVEGMDVAREISRVPRDETDNPISRVVIESISIEPRTLKYEAL